MKNSSSLDYYSINMYVAKTSFKTLAEPLFTLFNKCVSEGIWSDSLNITKIYPLHKKEDYNTFDNFRSVATGPIQSKLFGHIIKNRLVKYCEEKHIFSDVQFGFRKGISTFDTLLPILNHAVECIDQGTDIIVTMCHLTKRFDGVNVPILLNKLEYYGIRSNMLNLFSCLSIFLFL